MIDQVADSGTHRIIDLTPANTSAAPTDSEAGNSRICKFILVKHHDVLFLVFGDITAYRYHASLLRKFCEDRQIEYSSSQGADEIEPLDVNLSIAGGGLLELNYSKRTARFTGASKAYGPFSRPRLSSVLAADGLSARMKVTIK